MQKFQFAYNNHLHLLILVYYVFDFHNKYNLSINPFDPSIVRTFSCPLKLPHCTGLIAYQIVLIERAKWAQKRYLRFDIKDIIERKEDNTLKAISVLLHSSTIAPTDGLSLLDTLDENSHKHSFGVTQDLKYSLRSAVELLGNEAIYYHQKKFRMILFLFLLGREFKI